MTVFDDNYAAILEDDAHSVDEERFVMLGLNEKTNLLMVCHCYKNNDDIIHIISARKAHKYEEKMYGGKR